MFALQLPLPLLLAQPGPSPPVLWATVEAKSGAPNATLIPLPDTGVLYFMALGPYDFAPTAATVVHVDPEGRELEEAGKPGRRGPPIAVTERRLDLFYPIRVLRWDVGPAPTDRPRRLRAVKRAGPGQNLHPFWQQIIVLNGTSVLDRAPTLGRRQAGVPLAGLPPAVRRKTFAAGYEHAQNASLLDPVLTSLDPADELTDRDPRIEAAAFPQTAMKIAFAARHTVPAPMFAYNTGLWFTMNNHAAAGETGPDHMDSWAYPGLLVGGDVVTPAPVAAETAWEQSPRSGRFVPILRVTWVADAVRVTQRLSSQMIRNVSVGVAHFTLSATAAPATATRFVVAVGRKGGVRDTLRDEFCEPGTACREEVVEGSLSYPGQWAAMHAWNHYEVETSNGSSIVANGDCPDYLGHLNAGITTMLSSAPLTVHSVGVTETRFEVTLPPGALRARGDEVEFYLALPQGETCWDGAVARCRPAGASGAARINGSLPTHADFAAAELAMVRSWDTMYSSTATRFDFPSSYWNEHADIWLTQVASLARAGNDPLHLYYGAGEIYGDDFEGIEEGWEPRAMDYYGFTAEAELETEILLDLGCNLNRSIKGAQYRNGLAQHYAVSHGLLSGSAEWIRKIAPILAANTNWTAEQRRLGPRDGITRGLLPKRFYDSSDVRIPAYPIYSNVACWRGAADTAFLLSRAGGRVVSPETAKFLESEAADYRATLLGTLCREANTSVAGQVFMPLALEIGEYNGTGPRPPNEQPYPFVANKFNQLSNYWSLWYNLVLHLDLWQFSADKPLVNGTDAMDPWSGACRPDGTTDPSKAILPDAILTTWGEQHAGLWGGLPRFFSGLDAVYHGWAEHVIRRAATTIRWRQRAVAAVEAFMMHAVSSDGFSSAEVTPLFPRRFNRTLQQFDAEMAPWQLYHYEEAPAGEDTGELSDVLPAGAAAGLCLLRKATILETATAPSPHPDGGLFLLPAVPANFLAVGGPGLTLRSAPTAYGLVDFVARRPTAGAVVASFRYARHAGGFSLPLANVTMRLVTPDATGVRAAPPAVAVDAWTLRVPVVPDRWHNFSFRVI